MVLLKYPASVFHSTSEIFSNVNWVLHEWSSFQFAEQKITYKKRIAVVEAVSFSYFKLIIFKIGAPIFKGYFVKGLLTAHSVTLSAHG